MFEALKTWIEGLFRPVFRVDSQGSQYIQANPTIWDLAYFKAMRYGQQNTRQGIVGPLTTTITGPRGCDWILWSISAEQCNSYVQCCIMEGANVVMGLPWHTGAMGGADQFMGGNVYNSPILIRNGCDLRVERSSVAAAAYSQVTYAYTEI